MSALGLGELLVEVGEPRAVGGLGLQIEQRTGVIVGRGGRGGPRRRIFSTPKELGKEVKHTPVVNVGVVEGVLDGG